MAWVRSRPLALLEEGVLFVHAGVLPSWTVEQTLSLADEFINRWRRITTTHFAPDLRREPLDGVTISPAMIGSDAWSMRSHVARVVVRRTMNLKHNDNAAKTPTALCRGLIIRNALHATRWSCSAIGRLKA